MKTCPLCHRTYDDDTFAFCLDDGSTLTDVRTPHATKPANTRDTDPPKTEILPPELIPGGSQQRRATEPAFGAFTNRTPDTPHNHQRGNKHWVALSAILVLTAIGLGVALTYVGLKSRNKPTTDPSTVSTSAPVVTNTPTPTETPTPTPTPSPMAIPFPTTGATVTETKLPDEVSGDWIAGVWEGRGYQTDTKTNWAVRLTAKDGKYLVEYPSIPCRATWTLIQKTDSDASFAERITQNPNLCVNGEVFVRKLSDSRISCRYTYVHSKAVIATAELTKKVE